jgi:hypothetical protein
MPTTRDLVSTSEEGVEQQRVVLEDGDLLVLGPRTNAQLKRAVLPIKADRTIKQWRSYKPRISVVLISQI